MDEKVATRLRRGDASQGGRLPDVGLYFLLEWAHGRKVNLAELSRRLAEKGVPPTGPGSDEPDLARRWESILRTGIRRFRKRRADRPA